MATPSRVTIAPNGEIRFLVKAEHAGLLELGEARIQRASHVLPRNRVLKAAFRYLRDRYGETGRVADFTRKWPCLWEVDLSPSNGPMIGPFISRENAIIAEEDWLIKNNWGRIPQ